MSEQRRDDERDDDEAAGLKEGQAMFDHDALDSELPESVTHAELVEHNRRLWKQNGDDR